MTWAVTSDSGNSPVATTNFPDFGPGVVQAAGALGSGSDTTDPTALIGEGMTLGVGRISDTGTSFAAILRALQGNADTNIISTPTLVTTDNEEASINVGQEVPLDFYPKAAGAKDLPECACRLACLWLVFSQQR